MASDETEFAKVTVVTEREIRVPIDLLGDDDPTPPELRERAEDWFWNWPWESLDNEPGPSKEDISVTGVTLPRSVYKTEDGDRACTGCGTSVEDESYLFWLFHTCPSCAQGPEDAEGGDEADA